MNNKRNKLNIKENWDKDLTLSESEKRFLVAGNGGDDDDDCPITQGAKTERPVISFVIDKCGPGNI